MNFLAVAYTSKLETLNLNGHNKKPGVLCSFLRVWASHGFTTLESHILWSSSTLCTYIVICNASYTPASVQTKYQPIFA